jgi:two-component system, response regulator YesN
MYKAILVEDEIIIRENVRDNFPWQEHGLVLAGEAADGESALQIIEDVRPQVVITDIKMPFLNGLELSRIVRQQMPWVKIIIMTGHDEFELAQQALKIGVSDYLLKPIGLSDLSASLKAVVARIREEEQELENIERLQTETEINKNYLKNDALRDLLAGALSLSKVYELAGMLDIQLKAAWYAAVLLRLNLPEQFAGDSYAELIKAVSLINAFTEQSVLIVRQSLKEQVLIVKGGEQKALENSCYRIGSAVKAEVEAKTQVRLSIYIGGVKKRLQELSLSYEEAMHTASLSYLFGANRIVGLEDIKVVNPYHGKLIPFERRELSKFLRTGAEEEVEGFVESHRSRFAAFPRDIFHLMLIRFNLYYEIGNFLEELGFYGDNPEYHNTVAKLMVDCSEEHSQEQVTEQARRAIAFAIGQRELRKAQKYDVIIEKAKAYIQEHYSESTLQLPDAAAHVGISSGHLSTIFSQESGVSYTDYVTRVRIEKAKEMLRTTEMSSAEIAFTVGYNDPHYFYNIFKKVAGVTSSTYRHGDRRQEPERETDT